MLKKYLLNLYKNLNLYSNFNFIDYVNANKKNMNILIGGDPDYYQKVFLDLFDKIKLDLSNIREKQLKINKSNTNEIAVKLRTFKVFVELYQNYIVLLMDEHKEVKGKIDNIYTISQDEKTKKVVNAVEDLTKQFKELLEP